MDLSYETERLTIKVLDETYYEKVHDYFMRNRKFFEEFESKREESYFAFDRLALLLKKDLKNLTSGNVIRLWLFKKDNPDRIIGQITFYNIVTYAFLSCHVYFKSDKDEINNGIMTEALKKCLEMIHDEYNMHRIEAYVLPKNTAALRVLGKLGFINEGIAHKYLKINGIWQDHIHMAYVYE